MSAQATVLELDKLNNNAQTTKDDVVQSMRMRLLQLMRHVVVTPMIGEVCLYLFWYSSHSIRPAADTAATTQEYAYPGDIDLRPWTDPLAAEIAATKAC